MATYTFETPNEKTISGTLALVMHALFLILLIFGVNWKKPEPAAMVAELWSSLPSAPSPKTAVPPPPPKPQSKLEPEPPPPPKMEAKPLPKAEPKPPLKADIDLREKQEKAKKAKDEAVKKKLDAAERAKAEALKQQLAKEEEAAKRREKEQQQVVEALKEVELKRLAAQAKVIDEYIAKIQAKIKSRINRAGCLSVGNPEIHLKVILLPDGNVLNEPEVRKSSGVSACDIAVARAVLLAQPLPLPADTALFPRFRDLDLRLRPND